MGGAQPYQGKKGLAELGETGLEVGNGLGGIKSGGQRRIGSKICFLVQVYSVRIDLAEWKGCIWPVRSL